MAVAGTKEKWNRDADALPIARRLLVYSVVAIAFLAVTVLGAVVYAVWQIDDAAVDHESGRARIALTANSVETAGSEARLASTLSNSYALEGAHIGTAAEIGEGEIAVPLPGHPDRLVIWTPHRFGSELFMQLAPIRGATSLVFLIGIGFLMRRLYVLARELEGRRREAQELAARDPLTGLGNRLAFDTGMTRMLAKGTGEVAVFYLDLDGFKQVNDSFGHGAGDDVLRNVGHRLARLARPDDLLVRLGGDEFVLLRPAPGPRAELGQVAHEIEAAVIEPVLLGTQTLQIGVSIGIAVAPIDGTSGIALLAAADAALYRAKRDRSGYALAA
jgi:diguanylate cyclase (GGDEF)-like protein